MASSREIRSKISSVKSIKKITNAMQMVAASKMRKAKDRMSASRPYANKTLDVISHLADAHPQYRHPYMQVRHTNRVGFIVMTTDRGLCGALNINVLKSTFMELKKWKDRGVEQDLCLVGNKADAFFRRFGGNIVVKASHIRDEMGLHDLIGAIKTMLDAYTHGRIDALFITFNRFVNTMIQRPEVLQLLPIIDRSKEEKERTKHNWDYLYEPNPESLMDKLLRRYIESQVYQAAVETMACEQAARMMSMKNATDNAAKLIDDLKLSYNKVRQATITRELTEIVAGAQAIGA